MFKLHQGLEHKMRTKYFQVKFENKNKAFVHCYNSNTDHTNDNLKVVVVVFFTLLLLLRPVYTSAHLKYKIFTEFN